MPLIWRRLFLLCSMTGMHWQPADDYLDDPKLWKDVKGLTESGLSINARCHPRFAHSLQLVIMDGLSCLSIAKVTLGKVSKLANLVHQSPLFRSATEDAFGSSRSVPETNSTWWNSVWQQLQAVVQLELQNLIFAKVKKTMTVRHVSFPWNRCCRTKKMTQWIIDSQTLRRFHLLLQCL